jgi:hypothetical protein
MTNNHAAKAAHQATASVVTVTHQRDARLANPLMPSQLLQENKYVTTRT